MSKKTPAYLQRIFSFFMIAIISCMIVNKAVFMHSHVMADGTVVTHAHPYDKESDRNPYKSHKHSNSEILFFQQLSIFFAIAIIAFSIFLLFSKSIYAVFILTRTALICYLTKKGRAPPVS